MFFLLKFSTCANESTVCLWILNTLEMSLSEIEKNDALPYVSFFCGSMMLL